MHDYPHLALFSARTRQAVKRAAAHAARTTARSAAPSRQRSASQCTPAVDCGPTPTPSGA